MSVDLHEDAAIDETERFRQICARLNVQQLRFVAARINVDTDREAAEACGLGADCITNWKRKGAPIDEAVRLLAMDGVILAGALLRHSVAEAAMVKRSGLDSIDERIRQAAATDILDRELGRAMQLQSITHDIARDSRLERYLSELKNAMAATSGETS